MNKENWAGGALESALSRLRNAEERKSFLRDKKKEKLFFFSSYDLLINLAASFCSIFLAVVSSLLHCFFIQVFLASTRLRTRVNFFSLPFHCFARIRSHVKLFPFFLEERFFSSRPVVEVLDCLKPWNERNWMQKDVMKRGRKLIFLFFFPTEPISTTRPRRGEENFQPDDFFVYVTRSSAAH